MKEKLMKLVLESVDFEKLALGLLENVGEQALKDIVAKTATPIDDAVLAILLPALNPAIEAIIKTKIAELKASLA